MLLMVEKGIRGGICHLIHRYATAKNKYIKKYDKDKESSYTWYLDVLLYLCTCKFNQNFIKSYEEESDKGYILEADVEYPKSFKTFAMSYHFYLKE